MIRWFMRTVNYIHDIYIYYVYYMYIVCILYVYLCVCVSMSENGISQKRYDNSGKMMMYHGNSGCSPKFSDKPILILPSGKRLPSELEHHHAIFMGKSTVSMGIFNIAFRMLTRPGSRC